jgi:hypothetical protein
MHLDEPFPLEAVPSRVRRALLGEFKGRCPSVREVDQIPDKHWLATPGVGPSILQMIRSITNVGLEQDSRHLTSRRLSDAELLKRLELLQEDLRWVADHLKTLLPRDARGRPYRQQPNRRTRNVTGNPGHQSGETEVPHHQNDQDRVA